MKLLQNTILLLILTECFFCQGQISILGGEDGTQSDKKDLTVFLSELRTDIITQNILDPRSVGEDPSDANMDLSKLQIKIYFCIRNIENRFNTVFGSYADLLTACNEHSIKQDAFSLQRRKTILAFIQIQSFFIDTIDKKCLSTNRFFSFSDEFSIRTAPDLDMSQEEFDRMFDLIIMETDALLEDKVFPAKQKKEQEAFRKRIKEFDKTLLQWKMELVEYELQHGLRQLQPKLLKQTHKCIVDLYKKEPRADDELLGLFKESKYPEKEKVKILMELGIPYDNYRIWESTDGLFKTTAKFISWEQEGVTLEKADGKRTTIEFDVLRAEDQEFVQQLPPVFRTWTSASGTYTIEAKYVSSTDKIVMLERKDGAILEVILADVSPRDKEHVRLQREKDVKK